MTTQTLAWCTWYAELAHSARSCTPVHVVSHLTGSRSESCHVISIVIHERFSLSRVSSSTSTCPFLSSSFPSASCTASCTLSSTTWSSWKACATPPTRGVTTPTTSPPPSHFPPPCGWCSPLSCSCVVVLSSPLLSSVCVVVFPSSSLQKWDTSYCQFTMGTNTKKRRRREAMPPKREGGGQAPPPKSGKQRNP